MKKSLILLFYMIATNSLAENNLKSHIILHPRETASGLPFSTRSSEDGLCKRLGFKYGVEDSLRPTYQSINGHLENILVRAKKRSLVIDQNGGILKQRYGHFIRSITCLK
jgi:hypothetical protein